MVSGESGRDVFVFARSGFLLGVARYKKCLDVSTVTVIKRGGRVEGNIPSIAGLSLPLICCHRKTCMSPMLRCRAGFIAAGIG